MKGRGLEEARGSTGVSARGREGVDSLHTGESQGEPSRESCRAHDVTVSKTTFGGRS